jgi:6-phosphogluconolactonase
MRVIPTVLVTMATATVAAAVPADTFVYVSDAGGKAIKSYRIAEADGTLQPVETLPVGGAPGSLGVDPARGFLFASIRSTNALASFSLDATTGKLRPINSTALAAGANAAYVATDRSGRFLFAASYSGGRVTVHAIAADGRLGEAPVQTVETAKTAHAAVVSLDNRRVFVPHVSSNSIHQFRFDDAKGLLEAMNPAPGGAASAGPRHLAIHPSGAFAFSSDEQGNSVTLYSLSASEGLQVLQTVSTLPTGFAERNTTADVKVHPSGKFVWVSNRGHDSLAGFAFDGSSRQLKSLGQTPTEKTPRSFDIEPSGRYIYCGGEGSGRLAAYRVDPSTGALTRFETYDVGTSLSWVTCVRP